MSMISTLRSLELRIPPPVQFMVVAALMKVVEVLMPASFAVPATGLVVAVLVLAGAVAGMSGVLSFRRQATTINPHTPENTSSLVVSGIYRLSRNPMYLGLLLMLLAWGVYLANWVSLLLIPMFITSMNLLQIRPEERVLSEHFGTAYHEYCQSVRRWL